MAKGVPTEYTRKEIHKDFIRSLRSTQVGDIVILRNDGTSCCVWKLARVTETINGRDGVARAAKVQVMTKNKVITLRHSIQ